MVKLLATSVTPARSAIARMDFRANAEPDFMMVLLRSEVVIEPADAPETLLNEFTLGPIAGASVIAIKYSN